MSYKIVLSDEELQLPAIDKLMNLAIEYLESSKETKGRLKTRAANKKNDVLLEQIINFQVPPIQISNEPPKTEQPTNNSRLKRSDSCLSTDSESSRPITRSLRPRTPSLQQQNQQKQTSGRSTPCTPTNQRIRSKPTSGASSSAGSGTSSNFSASKLRHALRADSALKKRQEEKERQEKMMVDRKLKEERAEAQKRQLLEERAIKAKLTREERLNHAAELRRAREQARARLKQQEEIKRAQMYAAQQQVAESIKEPAKGKVAPTAPQSDYCEVVNQPERKPTPPLQQQQQQQLQSASTSSKIDIVNETFKIPAPLNNIDIIIQDETDDGSEKCSHTAAWAKAPHLRKALVEQFSLPYEERIATVSKIFHPLRPIADIDLGEIFGSSSAVNKKYLYRTSSAVWTPPNKSRKRSSSQVTPTNDHK